MRLLFFFVRVQCYTGAVYVVSLCLTVSRKSEFCRKWWTDRAGFRYRN